MKDDLISREQAKKFLYEHLDLLNDDELYDIFSRIIDDMYNELPTVTPLPKGEWLRLSDLSENEDDRYECSHCGNIVHHSSKMNLYTFNSFCGRCGSNNER